MLTIVLLLGGCLSFAASYAAYLFGRHASFERAQGIAERLGRRDILAKVHAVYGQGDASRVNDKRRRKGQKKVGSTMVWRHSCRTTTRRQKHIWMTKIQLMATFQLQMHCLLMVLTGLVSRQEMMPQISRWWKQNQFLFSTDNAGSEHSF